MKYLLLDCLLLLTGCSLRTMTAPAGKLSAEVFITSAGSLAYTVSYDGRIVCDTSSLGVTVDGRDTFEEASLRLVSSHERNENYPVFGAHSRARDHAREYVWEITHHPSEYAYTLETRLYDDGFAYRFILPGQGVRHVDGEAAEWHLPTDSRVWFAERNSAWKLQTYAGEWTSASALELSTISSQGPIQTMPLLYKTTDGPYLMVTEAALYEYSGMRLYAGRDGCLRADFTEKDGFDLHDTITTPWRVLIVAEDLNQLVNTDIVTNLNPTPPPTLFADTSWIHPGRSLWSWWSGIDGRYMTVAGERAVIDLAAEMGYEYSTLDEGWEDFSDKWTTLREMADYAAGKGIGLFVWRHWEKLNNPTDNYSQMRSFMDSIADCGVKGLKIDFMNGEGLRQVRFTTTALANAARRRLLINFHGCQKPSGEVRTYPNELTREGVRGMELNRITAHYLAHMRAAGTPVIEQPHIPGDENQNIPASHNTILPFTRCVVGPADYTPAGFSMPGDVLPTQQLACAYLITSPLTTLAENPFYLFREEYLRPALEFLQELPTCWDETIVLPQSQVGSLAAFARRCGTTWYLAIAVAEAAHETFRLDFLSEGSYTMLLLEENGKEAFRRTEQPVAAGESLTLDLPRNGGAVARFVRQ